MKRARQAAGPNIAAARAAVEASTNAVVSPTMPKGTLRQPGLTSIGCMFLP
ncbi:MULTISPECIES: hypothetical protein [unclassified Massilia]|uniref:hypothetical protein n=1 Tax=unclassified Massilia TaxID=2609279 RepID=UPI0016040D70|nr:MULTISPECIES: hypothetical protein [unclassified Massilia]QNA97986.1 hypothetical protein G4G31_02685 [Massilia sp. Se16.2.3]